MNDFPLRTEAPAELQALDACGPIAIWQVATHLGRNPTAEEILRFCGYTPSTGTHPIGAAVALRRFGLRVMFCTDPDPTPSPIEEQFYREALQLGVVIADAISLAELEALLENTGASIILYEVDGEDRDAHLTPVLGVYEGEVVAPNERGGISIDDFEQQRSADGILRQCVLAWSSDDGVHALNTGAEA